MFEVACKKSCFSRHFVKLIIRICLVLRARPIETQNQDLRPLSNSFRRHKSNGGLKIDKRASVKNRIFQDKHYCLDLRKILVT